MTTGYRSIVYIDGFNLYYGIKRMYINTKSYDTAKFREVIWLDLVKLSQSLLNPVQRLEAVKYYTARITKPIDKQNRQSCYLDALSTFTGLEIIKGEYQYNLKECWYCHNEFPNPKEKQSDVNLATALLVDAVENKLDTIILIAADSDYKAPLSYLRKKYPEKRIEVEFIATNFCYELNRLAHKTYIIDRKRLLRCQLPEKIVMPNGYVVERPLKWK